MFLAPPPSPPRHPRPTPRHPGRFPPRVESLEDRCLPSTAGDVLGKLPLYFEANAGQTDAQVRYLSRGPGYNLFLTDAAAVLSLHAAGSAQEDVVRLSLVGANASPEVSGLDQQGGHSNYFLGSDPSKWHTDVPLYSRVLYQQVYAGVDVVYYGNSQRQLEYDFVLAPGADPGQIGLRFDGAAGMEVDGGGNLVLHLAGG